MKLKLAHILLLCFSLTVMCSCDAIFITSSGTSSSKKNNARLEEQQRKAAEREKLAQEEKKLRRQKKLNKIKEIEENIEQQNEEIARKDEELQRLKAKLYEMQSTPLKYDEKQIKEELERQKRETEAVEDLKKKQKKFVADKKEAEKNLRDEKRIGFPNLINTCFANSTTTLLFSTPQVIKFIENRVNYDLEPNPAKKNLIYAFYDLYNAWTDGNSEKINDKLNAYYDAYEVLSLNEYRCIDVGGPGGGCLRKDQCDASDMLRTILNFINYPAINGIIYYQSADMKRTNENEPTLMDYRFLSFDLTGVRNEDNKTIQEMYNHWAQPELIDDHKFEDETQSHDSYRHEVIKAPPPESLIIIIKRWTYDLESNKKIKVNTQIIPSEKLIITAKDDENISQKYTYNLTAISVHGGSTEGGHYYAYALEDGDWIKYDDNIVSKVSKTQVFDDIKTKGYIYSYTKAEKE